MNQGKSGVMWGLAALCFTLFLQSLSKFLLSPSKQAVMAFDWAFRLFWTVSVQTTSQAEPH